MVWYAATDDWQGCWVKFQSKLVLREGVEAGELDGHYCSVTHSLAVGKLLANVNPNFLYLLNGNWEIYNYSSVVKCPH